MIGRQDKRQSSAMTLRAAICACALPLALSALAQEVRQPLQAPSQLQAQPPSQPSDPAPQPGPNSDSNSNPAFKPGFIDAVGRWFEDGASKFKSEMQGAQEKFDKLGSQAREAAKEAAKDATGTVVGLPGARAITARERCVPAQNGAPDCQAAAVTLCRGKGFQSGKSLDTQSEQKCPAKVLLEGRAPNASECPTEMFVTRAMCQ
jgi:hypothetical protein